VTLPAPVAPARTETAARLRLIVGRLSRRLRRTVSPGGLTVTQYSALVSVEENGPVRLTDLALIEGVTAPTVARVVEGLVSRGFVDRRADPRDARSSLLTVSDAGKELLVRMRTERTALLASSLARLSEDEIRVLERALPVLETLARDSERDRAPAAAPAADQPA
jgi:DNA-binding MarR family transcriptional regulator